MPRNRFSSRTRDVAWAEMGTILLLIGCLIIGPSAWVFGAMIEAETFNRFTDGDATTWEAMWTNFRVDCN